MSASHQENESAYRLLVRQNEELIRESFRAAERLVREAALRLSFESTDARDAYLSSIPIIAERICSNVGNIANLVQNVSSKEVDQMLESMGVTIGELRQMNDEREAKL